ncbi:MAG: SlyX family protein [Janthinobacterium lividum]|jgi:SlyX protein|uniref:SlyX family protein n=1 Tax=Pseudomonas TaxID=286 RepID=UPI001CFBE1D7|nr:MULTISPECIES: SlyX family protein [Pseudomonas]
MSLESRVNDLESRLAFQDDTIQSLSDELIKQQRDIERLQARMAALIKRQEESAGQFEPGQQEAPPPHY